MQTPHERTMAVLKDMDNLLSQYDMSTKNQKVVNKLEYSLRWVNTHLDTKVIIDLLKQSHELEYGDVIIDLLTKPEFDPKQYN